MKSDIEIARETQLKPITEVAREYGIPQEELELYGKYKCKLSDGFIKSLEGTKD